MVPIRSKADDSWRLPPLLGCLLLLTACLSPTTSDPQPTDVPTAIMEPTTIPTLFNLIPKPVSTTAASGAFTLTSNIVIAVDGDQPELTRIGQYLADKLNVATGFTFRVLPAGTSGSIGGIRLTLTGGDPGWGLEGYRLTVQAEGIVVAANQPAGLFWGIQTLRQLLPPTIESTAPQPGPWHIPAGEIIDYPRYEWRGAMLDVARHFFSTADVKRYIDFLAQYKFNRFHLHLTDDQGWRIMINTWPNLARHGGSTEVGGGPGGYYTQADYAELVAYAQERYIVVIPEIDMPGHTNAALASYAELNCNGAATDLYTGTAVGLSSLCLESEVTYQFIADVIREIAALTPGPYIHIGGDEAHATPPADYKPFIERVESIVVSHGKQMIGWDETARAELSDTSLVQYWNSTVPNPAVQPGLKAIVSSAARAYLDMKYNADTSLGQDWAGLIDIPTAYTWDPVEQVNGLAEADILGIETALWTETIKTVADIEYMTFPRLPGYAEIAWSPRAGRSWAEYRVRLESHLLRLAAAEVNYYKPEP